MADEVIGSEGEVAVSRTRALRWELVAVCLWGIAPAFFPRRLDIKAFRPPADLIPLGYTLPYFGFLGLLVFVLWSSGDPLTTFGFRRFRPVRDLPIGLALGIGMTFLNAATMLIWYDRPFGDLARGLFGWRLMAQNSGTSVLILLLVTALIASLSSEIIFRSWLIPRIEELTGRPWTAVAVSAALFALARGGATGGYSLAGFLYGVATGLLFGIAAGVVFLKARSLWPLVIGSMIWFGVQFLWLI